MNFEHQDRRRFFRIEDNVNLFYKVIDEQTVEALSHVSDDVLSNCSLVAALDVLSQKAHIIAPRLERSDPEIYEYLKIMDTKINLIAQAVMRQGSDFLEHSSRNVNLSASGIAFEAEESIEVGEFLEIKIMLTSCMAVIIAYAKVIYCKQNEQSDDFPYFIGVDYVNMKDDDRELLIKHVVKRQMQQLRENKQN